MAATTITPVMVTTVPPTFLSAVMPQNVAMPQSSMVMPQVKFIGDNLISVMYPNSLNDAERNIMLQDKNFASIQVVYYKNLESDTSSTENTQKIIVTTSDNKIKGTDQLYCCTTWTDDKNLASEENRPPVLPSDVIYMVDRYDNPLTEEEKIKKSTIEEYLLQHRDEFIENLKNEHQDLFKNAVDATKPPSHDIQMEIITSGYYKRPYQYRIPEIFHESAKKRIDEMLEDCLLYTSPSPRDRQKSRMPSSA